MCVGMRKVEWLVSECEVCVKCVRCGGVWGGVSNMWEVCVRRARARMNLSKAHHIHTTSHRLFSYSTYPIIPSKLNSEHDTAHIQ